MNVDDAITALIREKNIAIENLTREQIGEAFKHACACGDFQRFVTTDGRQQVTYLPYRREQELEFKIKELEAALRVFNHPELEKVP